MERKIGEIFEYNSEWYQCIEQPKDYIGNVCKTCDFSSRGNCELDKCSGTYRSDKKSVIFKKLKKIGDLYLAHDPSRNKDAVVQDYKLYYQPACYNGWEEMLSFGRYNRKGIVTIQIEQKTRITMEEKKLKLRPFNLEEAKQGKPVCTRAGKPARIICWDKLGGLPIIALVMAGNNEFVFYYNENGRTDDIVEKYYDLMMAPERHEGWINVYKGGKLDADCIYPTKADALENIFQPMKDNYIDTIKVEWEE